MQPGEHDNQHKNQATSGKPIQEVHEPIAMPGIFPGKQANAKRKRQANRSGDKQQNTGNIIPGLMELPEVPTINH